MIRRPPRSTLFPYTTALPISAVQNIGAYGVEAKDIIRTVCAYDLLEEDFVRFDISECDYGYRDSMFKAAENKDRRSEEHTSELQSRQYLVCRLLLEKKKFSTI